MKVIAITNQKGGIGKTSTATALASILHEREYKTLIIDADVQANSSDTYRAEIDGVATLYDVMLEESEPKTIEEAIQHTEFGDIVAADPLLVEADPRLSVKGLKGLTKLRNELKKLNGYDYVIIDTPPVINMILRNVLVAADELIIPMKPGRYSMQGIAALSETINDAKDINPDLKIAGILLVDYEGRTNVANDTKDTLEGIASSLETKFFKTLVRHNVRVNDAQSHRMPLIKYERGCAAERDYEDFVEEYLGI